MFHYILLDDHFRIKGRTKLYESLDEMQKNLDEYLKKYNQTRSHQGRGMNGRTPHQVFKENLSKNTSKLKKKLNTMEKDA